MLAILLVTIGSVSAGTGFMLIGVSKAEHGQNDLMTTVSWIMMIVGVIAAVIGSFWYRANEARLDEERRHADALTQR
jgi:heme/copper-type cytochrome/quinol oxidase subunit 2